MFTGEQQNNLQIKGSASMVHLWDVPFALNELCLGVVADQLNRCGPQKFAKAIYWCLRKSEELRQGPEGASASAPFATHAHDTLTKSRPSAENGPTPVKEPAQKSEASNVTRPLDDKSQSPEGLLNRGLDITPRDRRRAQRSPLISRDNYLSASSITTSDSEVPEAVSDKSPILPVDDNDINLKLLATFMKKAHYSYKCATDGLQAVEAYKRASTNQGQSFRCILMDISMPVMDGLAATREIRDFENKNNIEPRTVIIALTGLASEMTQNDAVHSGIDYFRVKPVKFKDLLKILEQ